MTITAYPPQYSSVNDFLVWTCYSANAVDTTKENYKYIGEVWIGGVKVFTTNIYPNPDTGHGIFNFSQIIREYINASFKYQLLQGEWAVNVQVKVAETYYVGTTQTTSATTDDSTRTFFNHYNGRISSFTELGNYANKAITDRPTKVYLFSDTAVFLIPYFAESASPYSYDLDGTTYTITPSEANTIQHINIATGNTDNYTATIGGKIYSISVIDEVIYKKNYIHFLNKWGAFETMLFQKANKSTLEIERKEYKQLPYRVDNSGVVSIKTNVFSQNVMYDQRSNFGIILSEKLKLNTDNLTDEEYQWLAQLVSSPMVLYQYGDDIYPVVITDNNYDYKQFVVDGLNNLTINIEFGAPIKTQFR